MPLDPLAAALAAVKEYAAELRGATGPKGDTGERGESITGPRGMRGTPGKDGARGPAGQPGLNWTGEWSRVKTYLPGDVAESEGSSWVCILQDIGHRPPSGAWETLAKKGRDGVATILEPIHSGGGGSGGSALTVSDEGTPLDSAVTSLDFVGDNVTATNVGHAVTVDVGGVQNPMTTDLDTGGFSLVTVESDDGFGAALNLGLASGAGATVTLSGGDGKSGLPGGVAIIKGGSTPNDDPAYVWAEGGYGDGTDGFIRFKTGGSEGAPGQAIVSDGFFTFWAGVQVAADVPTGNPTGLPFAYDTTAVTGGFYFWDGAAWVKVATIL